VSFQIFNEEVEKKGHIDLINDCLIEDTSSMDKEPSDLEFFLSSALTVCASSMDSFREGDLEEAFNLLASASEYLGMAIGRDMGDEIMKIERKKVSDSASDIRHAENRSMKAQAIQYFKDNHTSFASKDDAAHAIAGKILPAKFATVREWLKGVKPE